MYIRPYKPKDKPRLRMICKETAFDDYKADPNKLESVPIMFNDYFTEQEPEYVYVIADEECDEAYGYIICATDYDKFVTAMTGEYTDRLRKVAPAEIDYLNGFLKYLECIKDQAVHFHIDMLPQCQRQGLGRRLVETLCHKLKADGFDHLSICCTPRGGGSYSLCRKLGFEEIFDYGNDLVSIRKKL